MTFTFIKYTLERMFGGQPPKKARYTVMTTAKMYEMYHTLKPETKEKAFFIASFGYIEAAKEDIATSNDRNQQALYAKIALDTIAILHNAIFGNDDLPRCYDYDIKYLMMYADENQNVY